MIEINELTKYYDDTCVVDHLSLGISQGEVLGLLGPNGAGKTTTLRMLTCYLAPTSGDIRVKDLSVRGHPLEIKKLFGYLPESAPLYPDMIVLDFLRFVSAVRGLENGAGDRRIRELADLCGLAEVMHKSIHELSKGYRQRVGLAHAMMGDPEILVLDEPTSGLDPNQIVEIRDIIREIGKQKTVVFSTHILSEAEATCDRVVIISKGKIAADGSTESLTREAGSGFRVTVALAVPDIDPVRRAFGGVPGVQETSLVGTADGVLTVQVTGASYGDIRPALYDVVRKNDWPLLEFHRESRTLEHIFRELTKEN
jgi:ABC-2 type transport system ATP-binding protein